MWDKLRKSPSSQTLVINGVLDPRPAANRPMRKRFSVPVGLRLSQKPPVCAKYASFAQKVCC
jgi:hypothetical protein